MPFVLQHALDGDAVRYDLHVFTDEETAIARVQSRLLEAVQDTFEKEGVELSSPKLIGLAGPGLQSFPATSTASSLPGATMLQTKTSAGADAKPEGVMTKPPKAGPPPPPPAPPTILLR